MARRILLCLLVALAPLLWAAPALAQPAAEQRCTGSATPVSLTATVTGVTSIEPERVNVAVALNCESPVTNFSACTRYAAVNAVSGAPWTAIREDGGSPSGNADDHIALYPLAGPANGTRASIPDTFYGNAQGTNGVLTIAFDIAAPAGAVIESGRYQATILASPVLIDAQGGVTPDTECTAYGTTGTAIELGTVEIPITIIVPQNCTIGFPSELDFGEVANTGDDIDAAVALLARCNSNSLKFNIYIDGGTGTDNADLTMTRAGGGGTVHYGLFRDAGRKQAFARTGMGSNATTLGPYAQTTDPAGTSATLYGRVPAQTRPAPGAYQDQVTVHVEY